MKIFFKAKMKHVESLDPVKFSRSGFSFSRKSSKGHPGKKFASLALAMVLTLQLAGCSSDGDRDAPTPKNEEQPVGVVPFQMREMNFVPTFEISGTLKAKNEMTMAAEVSGTAEKILHKEGDRVQAGDVLAIFKHDDNNARVNFEAASRALANAANTLSLTENSAEENEKSANLAVEQAEISLQAAQKTHEKTGVSNSEQIKSAQAAVETAAANLQIAENNLQDAEENFGKSETDLLENAENTLQAAMVVFFDSLQAADSNLCFSSGDKFTCSGGFSAKEPTLLTEGKNLFRPANFNFEQFKNQSKDFSNLENSKSILQSAKAIGQEIRTVLKVIDEIIRNSVPSAALSETQLETLNTQNTSLKNLLEAQITAITSAVQAIDDFSIGKPQSLQNLELVLNVAENQMTQAQANLANIRSSLEISTISTSSQVEIAKKNLESAQVALESVRKSNQISIQGAQGAFDSAKQAFDSASISFEKLSPTSPTGGTVSQVFFEQGDSIAAGSAIFTIAEIETLTLTGEIEPEAALQIAAGDLVEIFTNGQQLEAQAKVAKVFPTANEQTRRVKVEIEVDNAERSIFPNTFATAKIFGQSRDDILAIPVGALFEKNPPSVFVIENDTITSRIVETGIQSQQIFQIENGLQKGEVIVRDRVVGLENGQKVMVLPEGEFELLPIEKEIAQQKETAKKVQDKSFVVAPVANGILQTSEGAFWLRGTFPKQTRQIKIGERVVKFFDPDDQQIEHWMFRVDSTRDNLQNGENLLQITFLDEGGETLAVEDFKVILQTESTAEKSEQ